MDKIEFVTRTYMKAFNIAVEETHNPTLAGQIAFSVTNIIMLDQRENTNNPAMEFLNGLFAKAAEEIKKKEEEHNEDNTRQET